VASVSTYALCAKIVFSSLLSVALAPAPAPGSSQLGGRRTEDEDDEQLVYLAIDS
jgi:hypothetical protein